MPIAVRNDTKEEDIAVRTSRGAQCGSGVEMRVALRQQIVSLFGGSSKSD